MYEERSHLYISYLGNANCGFVIFNYCVVSEERKNGPLGCLLWARVCGCLLLAYAVVSYWPMSMGVSYWSIYAGSLLLAHVFGCLLLAHLCGCLLLARVWLSPAPCVSLSAMVS